MSYSLPNTEISISSSSSLDITIPSNNNINFFEASDPSNAHAFLFLKSGRGELTIGSTQNTIAGTVTIANSSTGGAGLQLGDNTTPNNLVTLSAPSTLIESYNLAFPTDQGVGAIQNDGNGNLSFGLANASATGQTTSITTTTLFTANNVNTGTYRVSIYIVDTGNDGVYTLQGTVGWTDDAQAQTASTQILTNAAFGYTQSSFFIELTSGNTLTYAVALTGTATYSVYVVAERLS